MKSLKLNLHTLASASRVFDAMYSQIGNPNTVLNRVTIRKLNFIADYVNKVNVGKRLTIGDQIAILSNCLHISQGMTGKMAGITSISTSASVNPICQHRCKDDSSICSECFAIATLKSHHEPDQAYAINYIVLNLYPYHKKAWQAVNIPVMNSTLRIESFGDVASITHAYNYTMLALTHKSIKHIGIWSKNLGFWANAFSILGKPKNVIFNASSPRINEQVYIPASFQWFVDHTFTVYDAKTALANSTNINCGDKTCTNCQRCYQTNSESSVNEILKKDSKRYYKSLGKSFTGRH